MTRLAIRVRMLSLGFFIVFASIPAMASATPMVGSVDDLTRRSQPSTLPPAAVIRDDGQLRAAETSSTEYLRDRYIVQLRSDVPDALALADNWGAKFGFMANYVYLGPFKGFAARMSSQALAALKDDSRVLSISPVRKYHRSALPTGISRIGAQLNSTAAINGTNNWVNADVVIMDGGIDYWHSDLNVQDSGWDCTWEYDPNQATWAYDDDGHATFIGGIIGGLDDNYGVVGVAPGARLWSIKIFDSFGDLYDDAYICGLATLYNNSAWVEVANLSFGGNLGVNVSSWGCNAYLETQYLCGTISAGASIVVAAGNDFANSRTYFPAGFSPVITVSALADSDGKIGKSGPYTSSGPDDTFADFSNYGSVIDLMAPGVDIFSTLPDESYGVSSGTSFAAPHVAGAAALIYASKGRIGQSSVLQRLVSNSDKTAVSYDPDGIAEPVLYVGALNPSCTFSPTSGPKGKVVSVSCTKFRANEKVQIRWGSSSGTLVKTLTAGNNGSASGSFTVPNVTTGTKTVYIKGATSKKQITRSFTVTAGSANVRPTQTPTATSTAVPTTPVATATSEPTSEPTAVPTEMPTQEPMATAAPPTEVATETPVPTVEPTQEAVETPSS